MGENHLELCVSSVKTDFCSIRRLFFCLFFFFQIKLVLVYFIFVLRFFEVQVQHKLKSHHQKPKGLYANAKRNCGSETPKIADQQDRIQIHAYVYVCVQMELYVRTLSVAMFIKQLRRFRTGVWQATRPHSPDVYVQYNIVQYVYIQLFYYHISIS